MLKGIDISHWQSVAAAKKEMSKNDFIFVKATDGMTTDSAFKRHAKNVIKAAKLLGVYTYAEPFVSSAASQAQYMLDVTRWINYPVIYALDWEGKSLNHSAAWALQWLRYVYQATGVKPVIYCSVAALPLLSDAAREGYGLWVADYKADQPARIGAWPVWTLRQISADHYDTDLFNGGVGQWYKYCDNVTHV